MGVYPYNFTTMKKHIKSIAFVFGALIIMGCSSDEKDRSAPVITLMEPHADEAFAPGSEIHFEANFSDNEQLASYKIDIHYGGDHTHGRNAALGEEHEYEQWDFEQVYPLSGRTMDVHRDIPIPTMINGKPIKQGEYHFGVYALDAAGNQSLVFRDIYIMDGASGGGHDHGRN
jgi:hypothetical protein